MSQVIGWAFLLSIIGWSAWQIGWGGGGRSDYSEYHRWDSARRN